MLIAAYAASLHGSVHSSAAPFAKPHSVLIAAYAASLLGSVHSSAAPFAKPHSVLIAAYAASLLIYRRSLHEKNRVKTHASMVLYTVFSMAELLL